MARRGGALRERNVGGDEMTQMGDSTLFSFDGRHCEEFGVAFMPEGYPFVPGQDVPEMRVAGRHGTLRWRGRTYRPRVLRGTMYLLDGEDEGPIAAGEMLRRASDVAAWLCGRDGRGKLILDAMPDRYFIAEVSGEAALDDREWAHGCARVAFVCQPFARSVMPGAAAGSAAAGKKAVLRLAVDGNVDTVRGFEVTGSGALGTVEVAANGTRMAFSGLGMAAGEKLVAEYTEDDILMLAIEGANGARRSAMMMRAADSDDDVVLVPGVNEVSVTANGACNVALRARGRWL